ncbi:MAG: response regulator [Candidatus Micrarchaeota archaeon]
MGKILIADDSAFMRKILENAIKKSGAHEITSVPDGSDAIIKYKEVSPDVVFLDISMIKVNGIDALKEIQKMDPKAKVFMCTAVGQDAIMKEATDAGAMGYIAKPFKEDQIISAVKKVLG